MLKILKNGRVRGIKEYKLIKNKNISKNDRRFIKYNW
jgi:hypothetical protein